MKYFLPALLMVMTALNIPAQVGGLSGRISDESGAIVPAARVILTGPNGLVRIASADGNGAYSFEGLAAGDYSVAASAPHLVSAGKAEVSLGAASQIVNLELRIASMAAEITVQDSVGPAVGTDASANASATLLAGDDLQSLSDDPDDLQADLEALAGPSAGPAGNEIFVDGFSGGQLPPKDSIREVRLNSNPFSPEYDKVGLGRIEIFTKPGTNRFHGALTYNFATDRWNSRNPYATQKAPFLLRESENSFSGPLTKRASFTFDLSKNAGDNGSVSKWCHT